MKKLAALVIAGALCAVLAQAAPLKEIVQGTANAGAESSNTFTNNNKGALGSIANVMVHLDSADTGELCVRVTRGSTVYKVYCKTLTNNQDHVWWPENELWLLATDTLSVSNGTSTNLTYSITITK